MAYRNWVYMGLSALLGLLATSCVQGSVESVESVDSVSQAVDTVEVCHMGRFTLVIPLAAVDGHLTHGDTPGPCVILD